MHSNLYPARRSLISAVRPHGKEVLVLILRWVSLSCLVASAVFFALSLYVFGEWNQSPVTLPLPGPGLVVATPFSITTAGSFRLEATVPVKIDPSEVALTDLPPVNCLLDLQIEGADGFKIHQPITSFEYGGQFGFGNTDIYVSKPINLPHGGDYTFRISNQGSAPVFGQSGALISFERFERPTESFLLAGLVRLLAWIMLALGIVGATWIEVQLRRAKAIGA